MIKKTFNLVPKLLTTSNSVTKSDQLSTTPCDLLLKVVYFRFANKNHPDDNTVLCNLYYFLSQCQSQKIVQIFFNLS